MNNHYLGMVRQWQEMFYDNRLSGIDLDGNPDFVKLAEAYGAKGLHLRRAADVDRVLQAAGEYNDGPCLIDAEVVKEGNVFPHGSRGRQLARNDRGPSARGSRRRWRAVMTAYLPSTLNQRKS